jgi:HSP20 family protein
LGFGPAEPIHTIAGVPAPALDSKEVSSVTKVRNILPKKEHEAGASRALTPFTHSMEEFFENYFPRRWMEGFFEPAAWRRPFLGELGEKFDVLPKVDIIDRKDDLLVRAEMPGVRKEDLEITIQGDRLMFEARREIEEEEKKDDFFRHEMAYGRLYRSVLLPVEVLGDKAKAELKDGILEICLPKVEVTTPFKVKVA